MIRRKRSRSVIRPVVFLIMLLGFVFFLISKKDQITGPFTYHKGWARYAKVTNVYDILQDGSKVWFATAEGIRIYNKNNSSWAYLGMEDGLLNENVASLDDDGNTIWIGTWSGINKYDKTTQTMSAVTAVNNVFSLRVFEVKADGEALWIGTDGRGLYRYSKADESVIHYTTDDGLSDDYIYSIWSSDSLLFCGGSSGSINYLRKAQGTWHSIKPEAATSITKIWEIQRQDSVLWMATSNAGVWRYNLYTQMWNHYGEKEGLLNKHTYTLDCSGNDVWVGTFYGIVKYNSAIDAWLALLKPGEKHRFDVTALSADEDYIWYGTFNKGLGKYFKEKMRWIEYTGGVTRDYVTTIALEDSSFWVGFGHEGGWADRIDKAAFTWQKNYNLWDGLKSENVNDIELDSPSIFFASWEGFYIYNKIQNSWKHFSQEEGLPSNDVTSIIVEDDAVWLGTGRGLCKYNRASGLIENIEGANNQRINALTQDGKGNVWVGTQRGHVWSYNKETGTATTYYTNPIIVITALEMLDGTIWIGTGSNGLIGIDPTTKKEKALTKRGRILGTILTGLPSNRISALCVFAEKLLVGSDEGMAIVGKNGSIDKFIGYVHGLLNNDILTLEYDKHYIWVGHNGGITRIDRTEFQKIL